MFRVLRLFPWLSESSCWPTREGVICTAGKMEKLRHKAFQHLLKCHSSGAETAVHQSCFPGIRLCPRENWGVSEVLKNMGEEGSCS